MFRRDVMRRIVWSLPLAWTVVVSTYVLLWPTIATVSSSVTLSRGGGPIPGDAAPTSTSLLAVQGASVLFPVLVPVLLTAMPLAARSWKVQGILGALAILSLAVFCVLGMFSIGRFFVPSLAALVVALVVQAGLSDEASSDAAA